MTTAVDTQSPVILVVDDEPDMRELARIVLEMDDLAVVEAGSGADALEQYQEMSPPPVPAVVVLDSRMPGLTGLEVAESMLSTNPDQVIIMFSAYLDGNLEVAARELGVKECIPKGSAYQLPVVIRRLLDLPAS